jgi:Glycosyl transferase family 2
LPKNLGMTIAICTWNRSSSLRETLSSLEKLKVPSGIDLEILIINNNCSDDTNNVVEEFRSSLPLRLIRETRQGHSHARNCAATAARGDYILWTDDDVLVSREWLDAYVKAVRRRPNGALFGGPIHLELCGTPPQWFTKLLVLQSFASIFAYRNFGASSIRLDFKEGILPYGANYCIRTREQKCFRYNPRLGRSKKNHVRGEEADVIKALLATGAEGWWVPEAAVRHIIPTNLQTRGYLRRYFVGVGQTYARRSQASDDTSLLHALPWLARAIKWEVLYHITQTSYQPEIWFERLKTASICWGRFVESLNRVSRFPGGES